MKRMSLILIVIILTGCAAGNKYNYQTSKMTLPMNPVDNKPLVLLVTDLRPYILNGKKTPNFVGLQRGGFGNPFSVTTSSGKPLTDDMSAAITDGLQKVGYKVTPVLNESSMDRLIDTAINEGASQIVVLRVRDWKSDIYMSINLHCDLNLSIYNTDGDLLAENSTRFVKAIGGAISASKNSELLADEFAKQIGYLFNKEAVRNALK
jgi:hypothetical protein